MIYSWRRIAYFHYHYHWIVFIVPIASYFRLFPEYVSGKLSSHGWMPLSISLCISILRKHARYYRYASDTKYQKESLKTVLLCQNLLREAVIFCQSSWIFRWAPILSLDHRIVVGVLETLQTNKIESLARVKTKKTMSSTKYQRKDENWDVIHDT